MGNPHRKINSDLIKELKLSPPNNISMRDLSKFIDKSLENDVIRKRYDSLLPTEGQLECAKGLGIKKLEGVSRWKISELIDEAMY